MASRVNGQIIGDPLVIANNLNSYFVNMGPDSVKDIPFVGKPMLSAEWHEIKEKVKLKGNFNFPQATISKVKQIIRSLKSKNSSGFDEISNIFLKRVIDVISPALCHFFDRSLRSGLFPLSEKMAKVVAIHKGGDVNEVENHRPISLLGNPSKVLERFVDDPLRDHMDPF